MKIKNYVNPDERATHGDNTVKYLGNKSLTVSNTCKWNWSRNKIKTLLLICWISLLAPGSILSQELLIVGDHDSPPKYYLENGENKGFVVDITQWVLDDMGHDYKTELIPWKRAYHYALNNKKGTGIIGLSMNSERLKIFDYSDPLYYGDLMVVVKKGKEFPFKTIQDLKGKIISVGRGSSYGDKFEKAIKQGVFEVLGFAKNSSGLKMLKAGRVDALLIGPGKYGLKKVVDADKELQMNQFSILPVPFKRDAKHLGIHKSMNMKPFLKKFNISLKKAWDTGVADQLIAKYYE